MPRSKPPLLRYVLAFAIAGLLVAHAFAYSPSQLLWACHIASAMLALGLVIDRAWLVAVGMLFHAGEGIPAYAVDTIAGHGSLTSHLLHTLPIAAGAWMLWGRALPRRILAPAWALHPLATVAAYLAADPTMNVMLSRAPYAGTESFLPTLWIAWLANAALAFALIALAHVALVHGWARWAR